MQAIYNGGGVDVHEHARHRDDVVGMISIDIPGVYIHMHTLLPAI